MRRRAQVLDAAVTVVSSSGLRGLTYQAIDAAAGVPPGTTSNCFRTRADLLHGLLAHLLELDHLTWREFSRTPPTTTDQLAAAFTDLARHATGPGRARTRARYALFLDAANDPTLTTLLDEGRTEVLDWGTALLARLGLSLPRQRYQQLVSYLDGVLVHQLTFPHEPFDPTPGFHAILTAPTGPTSSSRPDGLTDRTRHDR